MSVVLQRSGREPQTETNGRPCAPVSADARRPSRPAQLKLVGVVSREERLRIWGHLSHEEKQQLRKLVDAALREKEGLATSKHHREVRTRCVAMNGPFGVEKQCRFWAKPDSDYCAVHLRRMAEAA